MNKDRMGDIPWNFTGEGMANMFPDLDPAERPQAAENLSRYFQVVGNIYDRLDDEGKPTRAGFQRGRISGWYLSFLRHLFDSLTIHESHLCNPRK